MSDGGGTGPMDGGEGAPDAVSPDLDAGTELPDAYVAMGDAAVEVPDAYVEVPDAYVPPPDAYVPPPDACAYGTWYADSDGDGFGRASAAVSGCTQPAGTVTDATDCDDASADRHPGATEVCNMADDDCDGTVDDGVRPTLYLDADGDGYGVTATTQFCAPQDHVAAQSGDCNDGNAAVHPGATEVCNMIDDDCEGGIDEGVRPTLYYDADGDGHGQTTGTTDHCPSEAHYVSVGDDCNDLAPAVHPGATEVCNDVDDDCDTQTDEGLRHVYFRDADGDGFGSASMASAPLCAPPSGYVASNTDCNDGSASVRPGATETCNVVDDNCNGMVDEGVQTTWYADCDWDGYAPLGAQTYLGCPGISPPVVGPVGCTDPTHVAGSWITTAPTTAVNDCGPNEPRAHPGQTQWYSTSYVVGHTPSYDYDCDGVPTLQYSRFDAATTCRLSGPSCTPAGTLWTGSRLPICGESGSLYTCGSSIAGCTASTPMTATAACR